MKGASSIMSCLGTITIEPVIFLFTVGSTIVTGAALDQNLLIYKVCNIELGYNETICETLNLDENEEYENEVQKMVNHVMLIKTWVRQVPPMVYVFFVGAIADRYGKKPMIVFPVLGYFLGNCVALINLIFIDTLPLAFFYVEDLASIFGGISVYYLGTYGYGAEITSPKARAHRLARLDGIESLANMSGYALSPFLFSLVDFIGSYTIRILLQFLAFVYVVFLVKAEKKGQTPHISGDEKMNFLKKAWGIVYENVILATKETRRTIFRRRTFHMRALLLLQFSIYSILAITWSIFPLIYLYMIKVFDADGTDYAQMSFINQFLSVLSLLLFIPFLTGYMKFHESAVLSFFCMSTAGGFLAMALVRALWPGFYLADWATFLLMSIWGPARSLITKSVLLDEKGKVFAGNAILTAYVPFLGEPIYRILYDRTLEYQPNAIMFLTASMYFLVSVLYLFLFLQRPKFKAYAEQNHETDYEERLRKDSVIMEDIAFSRQILYDHEIASIASKEGTP